MTARVWAGLTCKNSNSKEKGMTEGKMVGWHHQLNGHELEQTLGDCERQGSLACYHPWGHKELTMTEWLNKQIKKRKKIPATEKANGKDLIWERRRLEDDVMHFVPLRLSWLHLQGSQQVGTACRHQEATVQGPEEGLAQGNDQWLSTYCVSVVHGQI